MRNIQNFTLISTFVCLWLSSFIGNTEEVYIASIFIFSVGLLHGANDIKIIKKTYKTNNLSYFKAIIFYVFTVIITASIFYYFPLLSLLVFITISSYHFGEQQFHSIAIKNKLIKTVFFLLYGSFIVALLLFTNSEESIKIVNQITNFKIYEITLLYALVFSGALFSILFLLLYRFVDNPIRELFNLLVFFVVFKTASLMWAFAIYFVLWHALPSLLHQVLFLYKKITKDNILKYIKSSLFYWLASVTGLFVFYAVFIKNSEMFFALFFSFLAAITFPHVIVMSKIFKD